MNSLLKRVLRRTQRTGQRDDHWEQRELAKEAWRTTTTTTKRIRRTQKAILSIGLAEKFQRVIQKINRQETVTCAVSQQLAKSAFAVSYLWEATVCIVVGRLDVLCCAV
jgi:hypothetical protein